MSISFECKNCGGELDIIEEGVGKCTFCRAKQPIPKRFDEKYNRANRYRRVNANFDEAARLYDSIIDENSDEAEAYWGRVLCRYGIEEVEDRDGDYKPTCHRTCESSIMDDTDFKLACEKANNIENLEYYKNQATLIDTIQRKILKIVQSEMPYDIFISFKDKDDETRTETEDSRNATILYNELVRKGYNVFFSKVTLRDKLGEDYEPYIYAALKSAKVMILIGTKKEYLEAKWVRNEWRRFNDMRLKGEKKKIIVAISGIEPEDVPYELNTMQFAQMDRMEFLEDIKRNIDSFLGESIEDRKNREAQQQFDKFMEQKGMIADVDKARSWCESGKLLLEQRRFEDAIKDLTEAVNIDPSLAEAYWCRMLAKNKITQREIRGSVLFFEDADDYIRAMNCGSEEEKKRYKEIQVMCKKNAQIKTAYVEECTRLSNQYCTSTGVDSQKLRRKYNKVYDKYSRKAIYEKDIKKYAIINIVSLLFFVGAMWGYFNGDTEGWSALVVGIGMIYIFVFPIIGLICNVQIFRALNKHKRDNVSRICSVLMGILVLVVLVLVMAHTPIIEEMVAEAGSLFNMNIIMWLVDFVLVAQSFFVVIVSICRIYIVPIFGSEKLENARKEYHNQIDKNRAMFDVQCQEVYKKYCSMNSNKEFSLEQIVFVACDNKDLKDKASVVQI